MKLLEKENWWIWLILAILSGGSSVLVLGVLLDVYDEEAWYARPFKKMSKGIGIALLIALAVVALLPSLIFSFTFTADIPIVHSFNVLIIALFLFYIILAGLIMVFQIQILVQVNAKLGTPGSEIYLSPYIWILGLIIPIIGWILLVVMYLYLQIWYLVMLYRGSETNV